jgi:hypothetical protein
MIISYQTEEQFVAKRFPRVHLHPGFAAPEVATNVVRASSVVPDLKIQTVSVSQRPLLQVDPLVQANLATSDFEAVVAA